VPGHRGGPGPGAGRVVGPHAPDPLAFGIGGDGGVDGRVVGGRVGQPRTGQVAVAVAPPADRHRQPGQGRIHLRRDDVDLRARRQQGLGPAVRHPATADDDRPAAGEIEHERIGHDAGAPRPGGAVIWPAGAIPANRSSNARAHAPHRQLPPAGPDGRRSSSPQYGQ